MNISYLRSSGYGRLVHISPSPSRLITVNVEGAEDGYLTFGPVTCRFAEGEASFLRGAVPDGIYRPVLSCKGYSLKLEGVKLEGNVLSPIPTEDWVVRLLIRRTEALEEKTNALEEQLKKLQEDIRGRGFFDGLYD